uniref:Uncharacterized protein n=1 Tax=Glossina pallidipes TaxID=7398 RepID=A0A1A9ZTT0_GLOPL
MFHDYNNFTQRQLTLRLQRRFAVFSFAIGKFLLISQNTAVSISCGGTLQRLTARYLCQCHKCLNNREKFSCVPIIASLVPQLGVANGNDDGNDDDDDDDDDDGDGGTRRRNE